MRLIHNWREAPRMLSMWCYSAIAGLCVAWLGLCWINDAPYRAGPVWALTILALSVLGAALRLVAQPGLRGNDS